MGSSTRLWNEASEQVKNVLGFTSAKKIIKAYFKVLIIKLFSFMYTFKIVKVI